MFFVNNIHKSYNKKVNILEDISFVLPNCGMVILHGQSGSGKTTLLNILSGSDYPTKGEIIFNNIIINKKNSENYIRNYVSVVYQDFKLINELNVYENVSLALEASGKKAIKQDVESILKEVGLENYLETKPCEMSGGEQQRCAIARAIIKKDAMIFADEPTGNLDKKNAVAVMELLKEISKTRLVVVVSHNKKLSNSYGDYFIKLVDGKIVENTIKQNNAKLGINLALTSSATVENNQALSSNATLENNQALTSNNATVENNVPLESSATVENNQALSSNATVENNEQIASNVAVGNNEPLGKDNIESLLFNSEIENESSIVKKEIENNIAVKKAEMMEIHNKKGNEISQENNEISINDFKLKNHIAKNAENNGEETKGIINGKTFLKLSKWNFSVSRFKQIISFVTVILIGSLCSFFLTLYIQDFPLSAKKTLNNALTKNADFHNPMSVKDYNKFCIDTKLPLLANYYIENFEINTNYSDNYYDTSVKKLLNIIEAKTSSDLDTSILYGAFPGNPMEIMIPVTYANLLATKGGYIFDNNSFVLDENNPKALQEIVGTKIPFGKNKSEFLAFTVSGVFEDYNLIDKIFKNINMSESLTDEQKIMKSAYLKNFMLYSAVGFSGVGEIINANIEIVVDSNRLFSENSYNYIPTVLGRVNNMDNNFNNFSATALNNQTTSKEINTTLNANEICVSDRMAEKFGLSVGQQYKFEYGDFIKKSNSNLIFVPKFNIDLTIKQIFKKNNSTGDIVFRLEDFNKHLYDNAKLIGSVNINLRNENKYLTINKIIKILKKEKIAGYDSFNSSNIGTLNLVYDELMNYRYVLIFPTVIILMLGFILLYSVNLSYGMSSKQDTYAILRTLGYNRQSVFKLMSLQFVLTTVWQFVLFMISGELFCKLFSFAFKERYSSEVLLANGWLSTLILFCVMFGLCLINLIFKVNKLYKKSIRELNNM